MKITKIVILQWLNNIKEAIAQNKDYLTELDAAIGDADHGLNMYRGFKKVAENINTANNEDIGVILTDVAMTLISTIGGVSGPLYGSFFLKAAVLAKDKKELVYKEFITMLEAGVKGIKERGRAEVGDKTMIDVWLPAIESLKKDINSGKAWEESLKSAVDVAEKAKDATYSLIAKKGRASYLGVRSLGHIDPGAMSAFIIIKSLKNAVD